MIRNVIYSTLIAGVLFSCGNDGPKKASTDIVSNPITADSSAPKPSDDTKGAVITFEKTDHDFGTITQGEQAEYSFKFQNTGTQDLLISSAVASCGCTVPDYPKEPIKPGAFGSIKVKFNSDYRLDAFEKAVTVTANTQPLETLLLIRGFINPKPGADATKIPVH